MKLTDNRRPFVVGIGELLWDLLPAGKQVGGAPANFAHHARELGADSLVISRVGKDMLGREILSHLAGLGLRTDGIATDSNVPTGTVTVSLDAKGKPTFNIQESSAWDFIEATGDMLEQVGRADAICFGTLAQRHSVARAAIQAVLAAAPPDALRVFDVNLRQHYWSREILYSSLTAASVLKLNDEELPLVAGVFGISGDENSLLRQLAAHFQLKAIALTKGADGSLLLLGEDLVHTPAPALSIVDTVGAGDAFTAALTVGLLHDTNLAEIQRIAMEVAGHVCTCPGATPPLPKHLRAAYITDFASV
jgi:fructokinase